MAEPSRTTTPPRETVATRDEDVYSGNGRGARGGAGGAGAWALGLLTIIVAGFVAWGVAAWVDDDSAGPDIGATVEDITGDPGDWFGEFVVVSGEVQDVAPGEIFEDEAAAGDGGAEPATAFTIGGDAIGEQLLVVDAEKPGFAIDEGDVVQVTGAVREFGGATFDLAFDVDFFGDDWFGEWEGRPAIVATGVDPTVPIEVE